MLLGHSQERNEKLKRSVESEKSAGPLLRNGEGILPCSRLPLHEGFRTGVIPVYATMISFSSESVQLRALSQAAIRYRTF
jgi:hypothetical protein